MNKEELEILLNKMYYDYVDREEAQKIIDYIKNLEKENQELKEELEKEYNKGYERGILDTVEENQRLDKENRELKEQNEEYKRLGFKHLQNRCNELEKQVEESKNDLDDLFNQKQFYFKNMQLNQLEMCKMKHQQKEFIEYMNKTIEELECDDVDDEEMKGYLIQRIDTFKEILQKYKEIIGNDINVGSKGGKDE